MTRTEILTLARAYSKGCARFIPHIAEMVVKMEKMRDLGKLNRWLGFMQGALWEFGVFSLVQLKRHNKGTSKVRMRV